MKPTKESRRQPAAVSHIQPVALRATIQQRDSIRIFHAAILTGQGIEPTTRPDPIDVIKATQRRQATRRAATV